MRPTRNGAPDRTTDGATNWRGRRVFVSGAAGFIGGRLAAALASVGADVSGSDRAAGAAPPGGRFRRSELAEGPQVAEAVADAEVVFHLAAANGHAESMEQPRSDFRDNALGTIALLRAVAERAPGARVVLASTRQLYGPAEQLPADESHRVRPPDVHSVHKELAEHLVRHDAATRRTPHAILRLTNTYGPGQPFTGPSAGLTGRFLGDALAGREITVLGDPELRRDFNHVDEVVDALLLAGHPEAPSGTWNLGGPPVSLREFAAAVFRALGEPSRIRSAPLPSEFAAVAIGDFHSDWSAIRRDLGWEPRWGLEDGLAETVRALREARTA